MLVIYIIGRHWTLDSCLFFSHCLNTCQTPSTPARPTIITYPGPDTTNSPPKSVLQQKKAYGKPTNPANMGSDEVTQHSHAVPLESEEKKSGRSVEMVDYTSGTVSPTAAPGAPATSQDGASEEPKVSLSTIMAVFVSNLTCSCPAWNPFPKQETSKVQKRGEKQEEANQC